MYPYVPLRGGNKYKQKTLLLVPDDVGAGGDLLLDQWRPQAMVETNQMKLGKGHAPSSTSSFALNLPPMVVKVKDAEPPACLTC